ncbi:hypothetical protein XENORESO_020406, partial [Xenotaenia resolanae]
GAFWGLIGGLAMGLCRMLSEFWFGTGSCIFPSQCPFLICGIHYLHFAIILFSCTSVLVLLVSFCTAPIEDKHLYRLVFSLRHSKEERKDLDWEQQERARTARKEAEEKMREKANAVTEAEGDKKSGICRLVGGFCGLSGDQQTQDEGAAEDLEPQMPDISEEPVWKYTVDSNALVMMAVAVFMWGYFA